MPDPGAEVVRRIEPGVHVGEMALPGVADAGRGGQLLGVVVAGRARVLEARPEAELELQLGRVAPEQERLEKDRRLGVRRGGLIAEAEMLRMPSGLARDRLANV